MIGVDTVFINTKKESLIQIRVSENQKKIIKDMAKKEDKKISEFILMLIENYYKTNF